MARRAYPAEFRRKVLDLLAAGRKVVDGARDLEVSDQTIYNWRRQDRIDRGLLPGRTTSENAELVAAKKRIAALETELAATKRAMDLVRGVVPPKARYAASLSTASTWSPWAAGRSPGTGGPGLVAPRPRGRKRDPEWAQRKRLLRAAETLTASELAAVRGAMRRADPHGGPEKCWQGREMLWARATLVGTDPDRGRIWNALTDLYTHCAHFGAAHFRGLAWTVNA